MNIEKVTTGVVKSDDCAENDKHRGGKWYSMEDPSERERKGNMEMTALLRGGTEGRERRR